MPFFKWDDMLKEKITPSYSPAEGPTVKGEKIEVGRLFYPQEERVSLILIRTNRFR